MILALHIRLVHTIVEQILSNTPFLQLRNEKSFKKFRNTSLKLGRPT